MLKVTPMVFWQTHKKKIIPVLILLGSIFVFAILKATRPVPPIQEVSEKTWPVAVKVASFEDVQPHIRAFGEIRAGREAELRARVSGNVIYVDPDIGDGAYVTKNRVILKIDDFDYRAEQTERQAQLNEEQARLAELKALLEGEKKLLPGDEKLRDLAKREVNRQQRLQKSSAGTRKALDDALSSLNDREQNVLMREQTLAQYNTQIIQAQSTLKRAETALLRAERNVEDTKLKAPFDGFLADMDVTEGKEVSTSDQLGRLIALERLEVAFHLSERDYAQLTLKGSLEGRTISVKTPKQDLFGKIVRVDARIDAQSGGRNLFASLENLGPNTELRPGLFVAVQVPDTLHRSVVVLPQQSLHENDHVYVVVDERLVRRDVSFTPMTNGNILIKDGLNAADQVVLTKFAEMGEGLKVAVK